VLQLTMNVFAYTPLIIGVVFVLFFAVEKIFPLRETRTGLLARLIVNISFSALAFGVAAVAVHPAALHTLAWTSTQPFGLMHLLGLPNWAGFIISFLLLDLSFYYWHRLNHKVPLLWRFHNVHHIDPALDVSTGFRFHVGEVLFSTVFRVVQVGLIGMSLAAFVTYELVFQSETLFHHSNLRLPIGLERLVNKILVSPRMHGIHHSQVKRETNSNYGVVFPWWDRLHKTLGLNVPQAKIEIGIAGYTLPGDNRIWSTALMPFAKQRDYWRKPDGNLPQRSAADLQRVPGYLAE
jgi:sterol desaturase/sphingolipid hydroxylase (fatty acid hydroxylase superfamily)